MSIQSAQSTYACGRTDCPETVDNRADLVGSFCSVECRAVDLGRSVLTRLKEDGQFCASCFRPQYHAGLREDGGVFYVDGPAAQRYTDDTSGRPYPLRTYRPTRGCACGTVDSGEAHDVLQSTTVDAVNRLWRALVSLAAKGAIDADPDAEALADAVRDPGWTWAYAAGMAVIDP